MADLQHQDAHKLLNLIESSIANKTELTYSEAAKMIGRATHSRPIAQVCDLLDAAACLAGVPLLALVTVRAKSGEINPKAWKNDYGPRRDAIINRSLNHKFDAADFRAISGAIDDLGQRGNRRAWKYVDTLYPGDLLYRRLIGDYLDQNSDAIDDLGTDSPDRNRSETLKYARDPEVRTTVLLRAKGRCEYCGELGFVKPDGTRYLESHHVIALANEGADRPTNVIGVCANDHREAHFGSRCEEIENEMILKLQALSTKASG